MSNKNNRHLLNRVLIDLLDTHPRRLVECMRRADFDCLVLQYDQREFNEHHLLQFVRRLMGEGERRGSSLIVLRGGREILGGRLF